MSRYYVITLSRYCDITSCRYSVITKYRDNEKEKPEYQNSIPLSVRLFITSWKTLAGVGSPLWSLGS